MSVSIGRLRVRDFDEVSLSNFHNSRSGVWSRVVARRCVHEGSQKVETRLSRGWNKARKRKRNGETGNFGERARCRG